MPAPDSGNGGRIEGRRILMRNATRLRLRRAKRLGQPAPTGRPPSDTQILTALDAAAKERVFLTREDLRATVAECYGDGAGALPPLQPRSLRGIGARHRTSDLAASLPLCLIPLVLFVTAVPALG
jgi:hypothetical protein